MEVENEEDIEQFDDHEELNEFCVDDNPNNANNSESPDFTQEISTLVSAIGIIDDTGTNHFIRGEYCHAAIARLEYLLRQEYIKNRRTKDYDDDTDNNEIFNKCGEFMVMTKKLIPCYKQCMQDIIKYGSHSDKSRKLQNTIKCLIKMFTRFTFPLTYNVNNTIDNYVNYNKYRYFLEYQQTFKKALIDNVVIFQIIMLMEQCHIDLDPDERSEEDVDLLELYLCLLRNILAIPNRIEYDDFLHDRAILPFKSEKLMDVLVELSTNIGEETDKIQYLLMDIFYQFFRLEDAESMVDKAIKTNNNNSNVNNSNESDMYKQYKKEKLYRKTSQKRRRHKNFGGLSRIRMMNGQSRIQSMGNDSMGNETMYDRRKAKRFRPVKEKKKRIYFNDTVRHSLDYVAKQMLEKSFTPLVNSMYNLLGKKVEHELNESEDCKKWIKLMSLFLKYHRLQTRLTAQNKAKRDGVDFNTVKWYSSSNISCVLKEHLVNFIISRAMTLFENRKNKYWQCESHFTRLEELLSCYKEIIRSIYSMIKYGNTANKMNGIKLFTYIFEDNRGPELIHDMINEYKVHQSTKQCLTYCIEAVYYTITILEIMQNNGSDLSVKTKKRQKRKKKKKPRRNNNSNNNNNEMDVEGMEDEEKNIVEVAGMEIHDEDDEDDEEDEDDIDFYRKEFEFEGFMRHYASNKVVTQYMYILEDYITNSAKLNSYIINMFNRLAFKLTYAPLLFQLKYFVLFEKILSDEIIVKDKNYNIVRKFCLNITKEFFKRVKNNKVLFTEILFHKTAYAISDINEPGTANTQIQARKQKQSKRNDRVDIAGFDDDISDDFDDEDEYKELNINMTEWTEEEDELLRKYYHSYAIQSNVLNILSDLLENELNKTRSNAQIEHRLITLGLMKKKKKKRDNNNECKKRIKPKEMNMEQRKSIIYNCIHKGCYVNSEEGDVNKKVFKWLYGKLDGLCDIISDDMSAGSDLLMDDIAIVPVEMEQFDYMSNLYVVDLLMKLGFLAPSKYVGTCWWRFPREFKLSEIQKMVQLMEEAVELPEDANLNELCMRESSMDIEIALMNDNINDNVNSNPFELGSIEENNEVVNDKKEQSASEEEYEFRNISEMKNNNNNSIENEEVMEVENERQKKKKKKKSKKHKKDKKSKKKKKKKRKKHKDNSNEEDGSKKKKKKHKRKSRKRKRDKMSKDNEINDILDENENENDRKRRRLVVNKDNVNDNEEDGFLNDIASDMSEDNENENSNINIEINNNNMNMNTPQINKFQSLTLNENNNKLNVINENENESDDEIVIKRKVTKRSFVSDSDSD